ncbi:sugar phosphate isomerase/epimerase family protein [Sinomonas terrae]|uniref:Sugar phosphate isomerase/epimerase n=1 Tax=Sinomonas terrae TaxID=2908838 RepID=A0ABS9U0R8_9MICC|nr:sugar phosphate isomerase/epimerase family protein [Sinomonas terrae]MCH6470175.1 sugar phosphate isomerase/epimerase [Sinomonas terrae]
MAEDSLTPSADWTIAAAMLQFPGVTPDGVPVAELSSEAWREQLQPVVEAGFTAVEVSTSWISIGDLPPRRLAELRQVLADAGLEVPGISVVRRSVIHPERGGANLALAHRTIDAAAPLGVPVVCLGLHDELLADPKQATWFWTVPGPERPVDAEAYGLAVRRYRELAEHASAVGVELSLELYEDTYLGSGKEAVRFLEDIGHSAVGLNPDVGNLIRQQRPIENWRETFALTLPHANYWHIKNYARLEDPSRGLVLTHPTSLELGIIDYREMVRAATAHGFSGAFVVEHYGGDGLSVGASNAEYLRSVLPARTISEVEK